MVFISVGENPGLTELGADALRAWAFEMVVQLGALSRSAVTVPPLASAEQRIQWVNERSLSTDVCVDLSARLDASFRVTASPSGRLGGYTRATELIAAVMASTADREWFVLGTKDGPFSRMVPAVILLDVPFLNHGSRSEVCKAVVQVLVADIDQRAAQLELQELKVYPEVG